jgi:hypothetical protein
MAHKEQQVRQIKVREVDKRHDEYRGMHEYIERLKAFKDFLEEVSVL